MRCIWIVEKGGGAVCSGKCWRKRGGACGRRDEGVGCAPQRAQRRSNEHPRPARLNRPAACTAWLGGNTAGCRHAAGRWRYRETRLDVSAAASIPHPGPARCPAPVGTRRWQTASSTSTTAPMHPHDPPVADVHSPGMHSALYDTPLPAFLFRPFGLVVAVVIESTVPERDPEARGGTYS